MEGGRVEGSSWHFFKRKHDHRKNKKGPYPRPSDFHDPTPSRRLQRPWKKVYLLGMAAGASRAAYSKKLRAMPPRGQNGVPREKIEEDLQVWHLHQIAPRRMMLGLACFARVPLRYHRPWSTLPALGRASVRHRWRQWRTRRALELVFL